MQNFNIYATLRATPTMINIGHEMIYITRGASAELTYNLFDKVIRAEDIDQVTFTFRQGRNLFWYTMFTYVMPSNDTEVNTEKDYYKINPIKENTLQCELIKVDNPSGNPSESEYFEISTDPTLNWKTAHYTVDPHFYLYDDENYGAIIFNLDAEETKQFKANINMDYEITLRLNTDPLESSHYKDSIIIEPQHQIAVVDSLYSKI